ncbi:preprotein translocase subunit SecG [Sphingomonas sp. Leaf339]|uniref:preprotein translocase subunit SecG n=1 Tax=Sphingomonas sp. Leaf339 TaxID=1736343 RepID=UPI0006F5CC6E|nr:preprotein translocase subunit SecG [Sphingomonas sp. Leaf339]KQU62428.1 preprotein translocase subunit SecG [Sphingomonas sp. Leaf339]
MFAFLLIVHAIIAAALVTVILMQRSEGGGLGMGGSPSGLMSARGAANFLSRATSVLASVFVIFSIVMAVYAATRKVESIDTSLARPVSAQPGVPQGVPAPQDNAVPNTPADGTVTTGAGKPVQVGPGSPADNSSVPLAN